MQVVILAAGNSSRFNPYNGFSHKSLIKIMGKSVLEHTLLSIKKSKISDVIIVVNKENNIEQIIGNGEKLGLKITYVVQSEPLGMGDALLRAEKYIKSDFFLLNAYHVEFSEFADLISKSRKSDQDVILLAKKDSILSRFGILKVKGNQVVGIVEKPVRGREPSNIRIVGIYLLTKTFLNTLKKVPTEHYHLEKALSEFAKKNIVRYVFADKETVSLKYPWDILQIKNYLFRNLKRYVSKKAEISKDIEIIGNVYIEDGCKIMEKACLKGPCYIGENAYVGNNVILRDGVDIEEEVVIGAFMELKNTVVMEKSKTHSGFIGDSVIGENCRIGAQFCTANTRIDRETVKCVVKAKKVDTHLKRLGVMIGDGVHIGIKASSMPGVIIGKNAVVGPSTTILKNVPEGTKYYTKFQEVVEEK
ncbi:MAG: hypothetical protein A3H79_04800 [Candidatus Levybacteria bacterium RIFCSPLOWO2_02_FULL_36_8b]|nr:MAG: hypothetical protein A3H79_04800 [Candidatus Levybacteria bacterium RIFCSPLOWO2_02_FULL_36_8b]